MQDERPQTIGRKIFFAHRNVSFGWLHGYNTRGAKAAEEVSRRETYVDAQVDHKRNILQIAQARVLFLDKDLLKQHEVAGYTQMHRQWSLRLARSQPHYLLSAQAPLLLQAEPVSLQGDECPSGPS